MKKTKKLVSMLLVICITATMLLSVGIVSASAASAPKITSFSNTASGIKITWGKVSGISKYRLYRYTSSGWKGIASVNGTSYVDKNVTSGTTYRYTMRCLNSSGALCSGFNSTGWKYKFVATPKATKLESTRNGIKITWGKVSGAAKYRVFYKYGSSWKTIATTTATSYEDTGIYGGTTRTYTVRCLDSNNKYVSSFNSNGWTHRYESTPTISEVKYTGNGGLKVSWYGYSSSYSDKYRVYVKKNGSAWKKLTDTWDDYYIDYDIQRGNTYTYTVRLITYDGKTFTSSFDPVGASYSYRNDSTRDAFINCLMNNQSTWLPGDWITTGGGGLAGFEFADLDFDGVNELLVQEAGGTMCNVDTVAYAFKNNKLVRISSNDSYYTTNNKYFQNRLRYYYNKSTRKYEIHGTSICAAGTYNDHSYGNFKLTYNGTKITTTYYTYRLDVYPMNSSSGKHEYYYYNSSNNKISGSTYLDINKKQLANCVNVNKTTQLICRSDWSNFSTSQKKQALLDSYNSFHYTKY